MTEGWPHGARFISKKLCHLEKGLWNLLIKQKSLLAVRCSCGKKKILLLCHKRIGRDLLLFFKCPDFWPSLHKWNMSSTYLHRYYTFLFMVLIICSYYYQSIINIIQKTTLKNLRLSEMRLRLWNNLHEKFYNIVSTKKSFYYLLID